MLLYELFLVLFVWPSISSFVSGEFYTNTEYTVGKGICTEDINYDENYVGNEVTVYTSCDSTHAPASIVFIDPVAENDLPLVKGFPFVLYIYVNGTYGHKRLRINRHFMYGNDALLGDPLMLNDDGTIGIDSYSILSLTKRCDWVNEQNCDSKVVGGECAAARNPIVIGFEGKDNPCYQGELLMEALRYQ